MTKRIFWLVLTGYLLVTAYFVSWTYFRFCEQAEQSSLLRLEGIANAIALQVDADIHTKVATRYKSKDAILFNTQDTNYDKIHYILARNAVANMLKTPDAGREQPPLLPGPHPRQGARRALRLRARHARHGHETRLRHRI